MFWFVRIIVMLALLATLFVGLGFLLPAETTAEKTTIIDASPEHVYAIAVDVERFKQWRSDLKQLQIETRGELWTWTEELASGSTMSVRETAKQPLQRYAYDFDSSQGMRGSWAAEFSPSSEGRTKLTLTETVVIDNPLIRVVAYVFLNIGTSLDVYLGDLNRFATRPTPDPSATPKPRAGPIAAPSALPVLD